MADEDEQFERLLKEFKGAHWRRMRSLEAHMRAAKKILESETEGLRRTMNVPHTPISARLKDKDKTLRTLRRRQEDRKQLRDLKEMVEARDPEARNGSWERYCREWGMEDKILEAAPFTSVKQLFDAMHDLAGIRVSIYFPTDIQKVVDFLRKHFDIVEGPSRKGGLTRDFQKIRKLVEQQRQIHSAPEDERSHVERMEKAGSAPELTFAGYRATHVVIRHENLDFDQHARGEDLVNIEVQIGSIIMHAWSDIEHDILYKPSETRETSPDVVRMLDLINGIVMTGEVALQQLASVAAAEATRQAEDRTKRAVDWSYMGPWLDKYFTDRKVAVQARKKPWVYLFYLFEVLRATDDHTYSRVEELLDEMKPQPAERLPVLMLQHLGRDTYPYKDLTFKPPKYATTWSARYWATCLVNTFSLASFMNAFPSMYTTILRHWKDDENKSAYMYRPTFAEFLDILHPTKPQRRTSCEGRMIDFCKRMLLMRLDPQSQPHAIAAIRLASAGYVARPRLSQEEEEALSSLDGPPPVFVPAVLKRCTYDSHSGFKITLSAIKEGLRDDEHHYFIPRWANNDDRAWKPVRREPGNKWIITRTPFANDESLAFKDDRLGRADVVKHLSRVLDVKLDPEEMTRLRELAQKLTIDSRNDEVWALLKNTRALGTDDADTYRQFMKLRDKLGLKGTDGVELAELARVMNTVDADELKEYRDLARWLGTKDPDELRALKQLASEHGTHDPALLRELREKQKRAEGAAVQGDQRGEGGDSGGSREYLSGSGGEEVADGGGGADRYDYYDESQFAHQISQEGASEHQAQREWQQQQGSQRPAEQQQQPQDTWDHCNAASSDERLDKHEHLTHKDDYRTEVESWAGFDPDRQYVDEEAKPDSKRERLLKGIEAFTTPWNKSRR